MKNFGLEMSLVYGTLAHFESKRYKSFSTISSPCVLNCMKYFLIYILRQHVSKLDKKNCQKNYIKSSATKLLQIFSNIYSGTKCLYKSSQEKF